MLCDLAGVSYRFDPGHRCLELAHTGGEGFRAAYETLRSPADLGGWVEAAMGASIERIGERDLVAAKELREAIWQAANALIDGRSPSVRDRETINRAACREPLVPRLDQWNRRRWIAPASASQVLSTIARDTIDLLAGPEADRLRRCGGASCFLIFVDSSRGARRRWCSMERCGNRHKVRRFRQREKARHEREENTT